MKPILREQLIYVIPGDPTPLARARLCPSGIYDPQKQAKLGWGLQLVNQHKNLGYFKGPIALDITFFMAIPDSRKSNFSKLVNTYHVYKPDISNMLKWVEDCAQGILYQDDCIISQVICKKLYSDEPRTELKIYGI